MQVNKDNLKTAFRAWYSDYVANKDDYEQIPNDTESGEFSDFCERAADTLISYLENQ